MLTGLASICGPGPSAAEKLKITKKQNDDFEVEDDALEDR
jgi:hypothetical protein